MLTKALLTRTTPHLTRSFSSCSRASLSMSSSPAGPSSSIDIRPGLERILPLLVRLDSPQKRFPVIHIAGTNSKGTTSSILDSVLLSLGVSTARFNSPHLIEQRDSCRFNGQVVQQQTWHEAVKKVQEADQLSREEFELKPIGASPFELLFAAFLVCAQRAQPKVLIVECGMGGLQDATNVFPAENVLASVITPIGSDHKAFLGGTLAEITEQKMGIAKDHGLVVVADQRGPEGFARQTRLANETGQRKNAHLTHWTAQDESEPSVGKDTAEVLSTIRRVGETLRARLVKCQTPFDVLQAPAQVSDAARPWELTTQWSVVLPPTLQSSVTTASQDNDPETGVSISDDNTTAPTSDKDATVASLSTTLASTLFTNSPYTSLPGRNPLTTPPLPPLPPTFPVLSSLSTALSTLYAIASDELPTRSGGGDPHEDLRLTLAFGLQASGLVNRAQERGVLTDEIEAAIVQGVRGWKGRGSWVDLPMPLSPSSASESSLHAFVDGAHNPQALKALFSHLQSTIIAQHNTPPSSTLTLTILAAFSTSKEKDGDLDTILDLFASLPRNLASASTSASPDVPVRVRVGFVPFSTPVQGMPWVQPLPAEILKNKLHSSASSSSKDGQQHQQEPTLLQEVNSFETLSQALTWASTPQSDTHTTTTLSGKPADSSMLVITGSLYLVADVYRLIEEGVADAATATATATATAE